MRELTYLLRVMVTEKKDIFLAVLFGFLAAISSVGLMSTGGYLISQAALHPPLYTLTLTIVTVRFFGIARAAARYAERYFSHRATFTILGKLRLFFYDRIEPLAPAVFMNYRSGDLLSRIVADVESLQFYFLRVVYPPIVMLFVFLATGYLLLVFAWQMAIALLLGLIIVGMIIPAIFAYLSRNNGYQLRHKRSQLSVQTTEFLFGFVDLKMNQRLSQKTSELENLSEELLNEQNKNGVLAGAGESFSILAAYLTAWVVLFLGIIYVEGDKFDGVFLALLVLAVLTVFESATPMASVPAHVEESRVAAGRLFKLTDQKTMDEKRKNDAKEIRETVEKQLIIRPEEASLEWKDVSYTYPGEERKALKNINLSLAPKKKMAIVGPSGSGKSSIINLLLKFYEYQEGAIYLGDKELKEISPEDARRFFSVIAQSNHFFNDTVRANLLLAKPDASDEELTQLLAKVLLPHISLDDNLNEKGLALSGGERQRLAIARMVLKDAPILLLDEPTTGLDSLTEKEILSLLWPLVEDKSVIYITHRLVGLEKMDEIIVIAKGEIIERGTFSELMTKQGYFYQLKQLEADKI